MHYSYCTDQQTGGTSHQCAESAAISHVFCIIVVVVGVIIKVFIIIVVIINTLI